MGALEDVREAAAFPVGVPRGASTAIHGVAQLLSITPERATISLDGSQPFDLPYSPGVYDGITTVLVLRNPLEGGRAVWVLSPVGEQAPEDVPPPPAAPPTSVTAQATILPTWTGTWSTKWGKFDAWQATRTPYGGRSTLYQGNAYGSGTLTGLATYGDQLANLSAIEITDIEVTVGIVTGPGTPALQASGMGAPSGAPGSGGDVVSGAGAVHLTAGMREAFRLGVAKGLCLVGGGYVGVWGTARADGMALRVTYRRAA